MQTEGLIDEDARPSMPSVDARAEDAPWARASVWSIALSAALHALAAALFLLTPEPPLSPSIEATPVEIWTEEQLAAVAPSALVPQPAPTPPAAPRIAPDASAPIAPPVTPPLAPIPAPQPVGPRPHDLVRATTMLSAGVLADARSRATIAFLRSLDADNRLEQLCNIEAMAQISTHFPETPATHVIAYAMAETKVSRDTLTAHGAAFRSKNEWINLAYVCQASTDRKTISAFEFRIGDAVPRRDWAAHHLPSIR